MAAGQSEDNIGTRTILLYPQTLFLRIEQTGPFFTLARFIPILLLRTRLFNRKLRTTVDEGALPGLR